MRCFKSHHLELPPLFATVTSQTDEIQECIHLPEPFKFTTKWNNVRNDPRNSDLISLTYTFHLISLYHWLERQILRLLWVICMQQHLDYWAIFRFFHPLNIFPSSFQITTSLRTTLCWRQPWSTKGFSWLTSELFRWNILVRIKFCFLYCFLYCKSQIQWWYNCYFVFFSFDRFTFKDLLPTRLLWFPSLWTTVAGVCAICNDTLDTAH